MVNVSLLKRAPVLRSPSNKQSTNHEFVIRMHDKASGLVAFVAIHSTKLGPAHGGTRMMEYPNEDAALQDALNLSRAMSYKSALAGLPYGGAKGVIYLDRDGVYDRQELLAAYASKIEALHGLFRTGTDVGLTDADVLEMAKHSQYMLGVSPGDKGGLSTSKSAALGVFIALRTALKFRFGSDDPQGRTVGIKGVGKLGGELAALLVKAGARVFVADLDPAQTEALKARLPEVEVVPVHQIAQLPLDVYAPCALGHEFTPQVIQRLSCSIVAGGANNQLPNDKAGDALAKRDILYVPDYIANAGGLIFVCEDLEADDFSLERVQQRLQNIATTLETIFERTAQTGVPTHRVANVLAEERLR